MECDFKNKLVIFLVVMRKYCIKYKGERGYFIF